MSVTTRTVAVKYIQTNSTLHFTGEILQDAHEFESITLPEGLASVGVNEIVVESITIASVENLDWMLYFWKSTGGKTTDPETDSYIDLVLYAASTAKRIAATGLYYYPGGSVSIPCKTNSSAGETKLHMSLSNGSIAAKSADAAGGIKIILAVRELRG